MTDKVIKVPNGQRYERNGWIRMKIWGAPRERGRAYGRLIKAEMDRILEMQSFVMETDYGYPKDVVAEVLYGLYMPVIRDKYSELADEMEGIVEGLRSAGSKATIQDVLLLHGYHSTHCIRRFRRQTNIRQCINILYSLYYYGSCTPRHQIYYLCPVDFLFIELI